jgi:DNA-nicking Smr family endonuclease
MKRRDRGGLSEEDSKLWAHVARSVTRIDPRGRANRPVPTQTEVEPVKPRPAVPPLIRFQPHDKSSLGTSPTPAAPVREPQQAPIEPRKARRVARGREQIGARIDLHGMRQVEAHGALRAFLHRAYHDGCRMVLVITGKGREGDVDGHAPFEMYQDRDRGVLRRNVPRWLAEPELRMIVVGYTSAHVRHGGEGAFYVQLRNPEKHRG